MPNKLVLLGAGKIGRSFIGQVFSRSGYEVVFVDINRQLVDKLNECRQYKVIIKSEKADEAILVTNIRAVHFDDTEKVIAELANASIAAVSVGQHGLPAALSYIAQSLIIRRQQHGDWPLDIIIAENLRNADQYFSAELSQLLPTDYPLNKLVGLVETSIGKMVPIMSQKDMGTDSLQVFAEAYNTLIVAKNGFKNPIPEVNALAPKENMKAWVDRKLFIHNLGHSTAAYLGYLSHPTATFMYEVLASNELKEAVRNTMLQAADILLKKYPEEFTLESLTNHIDDLLKRFQNKALGDTILRVGCDLQRKLSAEDRLAGAIHLACKLELPCDLILKALVCACHFRATNELGEMLATDQDFLSIYKTGIENVLINISGFDKVTDRELIEKAVVYENSLMKDSNTSRIPSIC